MSKSLNLYGGVAGGIVLTLLAGYNFADRNVANMPRDARVLAPLTAIQQTELRADEAGAVAVAATETVPAAKLPVTPEPAPAGGLVAAANAQAGGAGAKYGLGRPALAEEIAAWDVDVRPDGRGLPQGSGNAFDGETLFEENCASCHGSFAEGVDNWPVLAGGFDTLADEDPVKTVGSYWPYLSTVWDYVHRSMPFGGAQTLSADDTYAIVAYILYSNDLIDDEFELSPETFLDVAMPNADGFIVDDRASVEYPNWRTEPCMENCKPSAPEITMRATVLDVTPQEEGDDHAGMTSAQDSTVQVAAAVTPKSEAEAEPATVAAVDPALVKAGEKVFAKCKACHQVGEGAKNRSGPHLNGIVGRAMGGVDGFKYSKTLAAMDGVWDETALAAFLADPRGYVKGTRMAFAGLKKDEDIAAVTAYLRSFE